jgi:hypothetical protein
MMWMEAAWLAWVGGGSLAAGCGSGWCSSAGRGLAVPGRRLLHHCYYCGARGAGWCLLWNQGGASGCAGPLPVVVLWRRRQVGYYHDHERVVGMVHSGEILHRLTVGMMVAPLGCQSPYWGHHG